MATTTPTHLSVHSHHINVSAGGYAFSTLHMKQPMSFKMNVDDSAIHLLVDDSAAIDNSNRMAGSTQGCPDRWWQDYR